jgi:hypothetical protein
VAAILTKKTSDNVLAKAVGQTAASMYEQAAFVNNCGSYTLTANIPTVITQLNKTSTNYYNVVLLSPITTVVSSYPTVSGTVPTCTELTLGSTVTTTLPYTRVWKNPAGTSIGTGATVDLTNPTTGNYSLTVTASNGDCVVTETIQV